MALGGPLRLPWLLEEILHHRLCQKTRVNHGRNDPNLDRWRTGHDASGWSTNKNFAMDHQSSCRPLIGAKKTQVLLIYMGWTGRGFIVWRKLGWNIVFYIRIIGGFNKKSSHTIYVAKRSFWKLLLHKSRFRIETMHFSPLIQSNVEVHFLKSKAVDFGKNLWNLY